MAQVGRTFFTSDMPELDIVYNCTHDSKQVMTIDAHNTRPVYLIVDQDIRPAWYCLLFVELLTALFSFFVPHPQNTLIAARKTHGVYKMMRCIPFIASMLAVGATAVVPLPLSGGEYTFHFTYLDLKKVEPLQSSCSRRIYQACIRRIYIGDI